MTQVVDIVFYCATPVVVLIAILQRIRIGTLQDHVSISDSRLDAFCRVLESGVISPAIVGHDALANKLDRLQFLSYQIEVTKYLVAFYQQKFRDCLEYGFAPLSPMANQVQAIHDFYKAALIHLELDFKALTHK
jgi:hypothetical protein